MKRITILSLLFISLALISCKENTEDSKITEESEIKPSAMNATEDDFTISPITHATVVINWGDKIFYLDPVGGSEEFTGYADPDYILITDIHGDHLNVNTVSGIKTKTTRIIAPQAVVDKMPDSLKTAVTVVKNGASVEIDGFEINAIPMYNLREEALKFHTKGRGNGYVIEKNGKRVYISGDTEDIPEMRNLENIDVAFICMNLPYTMPVDSAASAVIEFKPRKVYPYHYRGTDGLSDVAQFKSLVNASAPSVEVIQLDWYPNRE